MCVQAISREPKVRKISWNWEIVNDSVVEGAPRTNWGLWAIVAIIEMLTQLYVLVTSQCGNHLHHQLPSPTITMTRGRALSDDFCGAIVNMARSLDVESISRYTGCNHRTIERTLSDYSKKGTAVRTRVSKELQELSEISSLPMSECIDWSIHISCYIHQVHFSSDIYLSELRELLEERRRGDIANLG